MGSSVAGRKPTSGATSTELDHDNLPDQSIINPRREIT